MREIKFRGITNEFSSPRWVYGDLICDCTDEPRIMTDYHDCYEPITWTVDPDTVGQFTGMYDAEGCEIYEGDVLNTLYGHLGVSYKQEWAAFVACGVDKTGYYHEYLLDEIVNTPVRRAEIKVIGNIHDDPGLLEG